ncbi:hypothetical protein [Tenacibaculum sp. C7A-26P2]|uniref:hypothetical protein n=1 Tax=Tenacibaculum sp. C7A-26P2 TaxID=3447504 RepID=UPI003F8375B7
MLKYLIFILFPICLFSQNVDYSKFIGNKVKINKVGELDKPYLLSYKILNNDRDSILYDVIGKQDLESKLILDKQNIFLNNIGESNSNGINLILKFSFSHNEGLISFIKYKEILDGIKSRPKIQGYIRRGDTWLKLENEKFENVIYVIKNLKIISFWEFYSKENNENFPKINKLKPLVKDSNGVLNIDKLAKVIKDNKSLLFEYLDN